MKEGLRAMSFVWLKAKEILKMQFFAYFFNISPTLRYLKAMNYLETNKNVKVMVSDKGTLTEERT